MGDSPKVVVRDGQRGRSTRSAARSRSRQRGGQPFMQWREQGRAADRAALVRGGEETAQFCFEEPDLDVVDYDQAPDPAALATTA